METQTPKHEPKIVLAIGAHPDDLEFGVSGSVAAWTAQGVQVHYLICTDASKGTEDRTITRDALVELRRDEQRAAAKILGVSTVTFFNYEDGTLESTPDLKRDIVREIRRLKPDTVVAMDPLSVYDATRGYINHSDHRNAGLAAMDAVYPLARDYLSYPELLADGFEPHKVVDLLFLDMGQRKSNHFVDISTTFEIKLEALAAHESQIDVEEVRGMLDAMSRQAGSTAGIERAESFIRLRLFI